MTNTTEGCLSPECAASQVQEHPEERAIPFTSVLRKCRKREHKLRRHIANALAHGARHTAMHFRDVYLNSYAAKLVSLYEANRRLPHHRRVSEETLLVLAERMDPWRCLDEPVRVRAIPKPNGGYRIIHSFNLLHRAHQILVRERLKPFASLHPGQYILKGGGRRAACAAVKSALEAGYKWSVKLDIAAFFSSLDGEKIAKHLPVPRKVVDAILVARNLNLDLTGIVGVPGGGLLDRSRRGIPQGSAASSLIGEMMMAPVLKALPEGAMVICYADDIVILTRTRREAIAACKALLDAMEHHFAGSVRPKYAYLRRVCDGFEFLGYEFRFKHGDALARPAGMRPTVFWAKFFRRLNAAGQDRRALAKLRGYVHSWCAAFELWEAAEMCNQIFTRRVEAVERAIEGAPTVP